MNGPAGWWELRAPAHVGTNRRRIAAYLKEWGADAIWVDGIAASQYVPPDKTALVDLCDSLGLLFQRQASFAKSPLEKLKLTQEGRAYRKWERKVAGRFPVVFISEIDRQTTGESVTVKTPVVIENGIDLDYFTFPPGERAAQQILFLGVLNYPPNADAAVYLAQEVFPLIREKAPEAELLIVGRSPGGEIQALDGKGGVTVFADVPDVRPFLLNSTVFICPLRFGAGVKNKILSAFAMKIPVVATSVALEGIAIEHRIHALFADSPEQLAESVVGLLSDRARADRMAAAGRAFVESRYSWTKSAEQFENALLNLPR